MSQEGLAVLNVMQCVTGFHKSGWIEVFNESEVVCFTVL